MLIGRPAGRADDLVAAVRAAGAEPIHVPLIATTAMTTSPALRAAIARLTAGRYDWVAFTSAAAVGAVLATLGADTLRLPDTTRVAAVGAATAAALGAADVAVDLVPEAPGSARTLAAAWPADRPGSRVLLPCSDRASSTLPDALRKSGHDVDVVAAYRTETLPIPESLADRLARGEIHAALVTSPSTALALAAADGAATTAVIAIGDPTARAAKRAGLRVAAVAAEPSTAGLIAALAALAEHASTAEER